jgi:hypothetical protein
MDEYRIGIFISMDADGVVWNKMDDLLEISIRMEEYR